MKNMTSHDRENTYWQIIDAARKKQSLTWESLSNIIGIQRTTLTVARLDGRYLNLEETFRIVEAVNLSRTELIELFPTDTDTRAEDITRMEFDADTTIQDRFWLLIDTLRKAKHWSWDEVSRKAGIGRSTISTARSNHRTLTYDRDVLLLTALGCAIDRAYAIITQNEAFSEVTLSEKIDRLTAEQKELASKFIDSILRNDSKD